MSNELKRECPNCSGTNINPVGEKFQCQSTMRKSVEEHSVSCGYIGKSTEFNIRTATKLF